MNSTVKQQRPGGMPARIELNSGCPELELARRSGLLLLALLLFTGQPSLASDARFPFPRQTGYSFGIKPTSQSQATMNADCQRIYEAFLKYSVTNSGCPPSGYRVHCGPSLSYQTRSEGIAWGMLIAVYMDNATNNTRPLFDGFNAYRKAYTNANGFMNWLVNADGTLGGTGPAIEADQNMALALLLAHYQWGSNSGTNYQGEAVGLLSNLMTYCVVKPPYAIKPGDTWGGLDLLHPCAWNIGYYPLFAMFTGDGQWVSVLNTHLNLINIFYTNYTTGLMPHWCKFDGSPTGYADPYFADYTYEYDACQTPWKYSLSYLWHGTNSSALPYANCKRLAGWINTKTGGNPNNIRDGYNLDGTLATNALYNQPCFIGTFGVAAMSDPVHQAWLNTLYDNLRQRNPTSGNDYYNTLIQMVSLLVMSGNFPNLLALADTNALFIQNGPAPAGANLGTTQAVVSATVVTAGGPAATGYLFYDTTNAGTNLTWTFTNQLGTLPASAVVSSTITGLCPRTTYYFMYYATNTAGQARWGGTAGVPFTTGEIPWSTGSKMKIALGGYTNRTESLTNFPVLVVFSNGVGGSTFRFADHPFATTNGCDLRFVTNTADAGYSLNYEIDTWNTGQACYVWVQVPRLPGDGSGAIWAEWGDPAVTNRLPCTTNGATWDASAFAGVWHLTPALTDSTANRNNGADNSTMDTNGVIGSGRFFANSPARYISVSDTNDTLDMPSDMTVSLWVYPTVLNSWQNEWVTKQPSGSAASSAPGNYEYRMDKTNCPSLGHQTDYVSGKTYNGPQIYNAVQSNTWQYMSVVLSAGSRCYHYINGGALTNLSDTTAYGITNNNPVLFGRRADGTGYNGGMDEVRIERVARSSNWVWACYQTMASNTGFSAYTMLTSPRIPPSGYEAWAAAITNGLTNATDCATGDGYPNLLKYATGSSPTTADGLARLSSANGSNGFVLLFNSNTNANDISIIAESCYRLIVPDWAGIASNIHGAGWRPTNGLTQWGLGATNPVGIRVLDPAAGATSRFFRLRVTQP